MPSRRSTRLLAGLVTVAVTGALVVVVAVTSRVNDVQGSAAGPATQSSSTPAPTTTTTSQPPTSGLEVPPAPPPPVVSLQQAVSAAEKAKPAQMTLGVAALNADTGELAVGANGKMQFFSASIAKLVLVVEILDTSRSVNKPVPDTDMKLIKRALSGSDDGAMNVLWGTYSGVKAISNVAARLSLGGIKTTADPDQWGEVLVTAADLALLYRHVLREMAPEDRAVIVGALAAAQQIAVDGYYQFFGLLGNGASERVYAKQGWVTYRPSRQYLHSAGVVHDARTNNDYALVLLSIQSPNPGTKAAAERITTVGSAAIKALNIP